MNSPLRLEGCLYDRVSVEAVEDYTPTGTVGLSGNVEVTVAGDVGEEGLWVVGLTVHVRRPDDGPPPPYEIDVRMQGQFRLEADDPALSDDETERVVTVNGAGLLYSGMRELVALITSRGPWDEVLLPTVDFRSIDASRVASSGEANRESKEEARPPAPE